MVKSSVFNEEGCGNPMATCSVRPGNQMLRVNDTHKSNIFEQQNEGREQNLRTVSIDKVVRAAKINRSNIFPG